MHSGLSLDLGYGAAFDKALKALTRRARSTREMKMLLERAGFDTTEVEAVQKRLVELGFLSDAAFAHEVVEAYGRSRGESRDALRARLSKEEIGSEEIETAILEVLGEETDSERAFGLAKRRARSYRRLSPEAAARRLASFLASKGYGPEIVGDVCRHTLRLEDIESGP